MLKVIELDINEELSGDTGVFEVAFVEFPAIEQDFIYFSQQRFFKAPQDVAAKACRAIKENEERGNPAATQVGKVRAQQLCNQEEISLETVKRMKSYLERAATYYTGNYDDNGTISYDLWGGKPALEWVDRILKTQEDFVENAGGFSIGDYVSWTFAGRAEGDDRARGQIKDLRVSGEVNVPGTDFTLTATEEEPVALIETASGTIVGQYVKNLRKIQKPENFAECPPATRSISINLKNRQKAIDVANYGPLNPNEPNEKYWEAKAKQFNTTIDEAKSALCENCAFFNISPRIKECIAQGISDDPYDVIEAGELGYCEAFDFKCAGKRTCDAWVVGGPVKEEKFVSPNAGESQDEFIGRCIPKLLSEGKTQDQAAGACYGMWEQGQKFSASRVGFDWRVLKTKNGVRLFEQEMRRGSLPVIFTDTLPSGDLIDFTNKYRIPSSAINQYRTSLEKVDLIEKMGLDRHYDDDYYVRGLLGQRAIAFDYDTSSLPPYTDYAPEEDEEPNLIAPPTSNTLMYEEKFELLGYIDGMPVFRTPEEAEAVADQMGCDGHHTHYDEQGNEMYMPCAIHPNENEEISVEVEVEIKMMAQLFSQSEDELEIIKNLNFLKENHPQQFEAVTSELARGLTRTQVLAQNHKNKTTYYEYKRVLTGSPDRDFCTSIEGRFFRISQIYALQDYNIEFGHGEGGAPYSKWLWKGGPNCIHAWSEWTAQGRSFTEVGLVAGRPGTPPKSMPNNGYYSAETKRKSEIAYIISQQNMSSLTGDLKPYGFKDDLPIYEDKFAAQDASYALGCGGIVDQVEYEGRKVFQACSHNIQKTQVQKQIFKSDPEKKLIYTPLMIPNILIPRIDETTRERYFVRFKPEVIQKIRDKFMTEQRLRETNYEHTNKKFNDIVMVESWIVETEGDKAYDMGFTKEQIPMGTWMAVFKILDTEEGNEIWEKYIKTGKVKGTSVEGNFILNFSRENSDEYLLEKIINILKTIKE